MDLRETIDFLKKKNSEAQAVIQGALNASEATPKGRISARERMELKNNRSGWKEDGSRAHNANFRIYFLEGEGP